MNAAWMSGLFEGEGSITSCGAGDTTTSLRLKMTDKDIVYRFHHLAGCGTVSLVKQYAEHHKPAWEWRVANKKDVLRLLSIMLPFFGERRAYKALNTFDRYDRINCEPNPLLVG